METIETNHVSDPSASKVGLPLEQKKEKQPIDAILLAYLAIYETVIEGHNAAQVKAKQLESNAAAQDKNIRVEAGLSFYTLPNGEKKIKASVLEEFEMKNQRVSALRSVFEDKLTVLRQNAQIDETGLNTVTDEDEQSVQQGGSLMQMLTALTNQISRI